MNNESLLNEITEFVNNKEFTTGFYDPGDIPDLYKQPIVGYIVLKETVNDKVTITTQPISITDQYLDMDKYFLSSGEKFVTVIPESRKVFRVMGLVPDSDFESVKSGDYKINDEFLGYEYEGIESKYWMKVLKERWIDNIYRNSKKSFN